MEVFVLCFGVPLLGLGGIIIYALIVGGRAMAAAGRRWDERSLGLRFLALNLWEPLNTLLVLAALFTEREALWWAAGAVALTLLLPALGLGFRDRRVRAVCRGTLARGLGRWGLNGLVALLFLGGSSWLGWGLILAGAPALVCGVWLLWHCVRWAELQIDGPLAAPRPAPLATAHTPSHPAIPYGPPVTSAYVAPTPQLVTAAPPRAVPGALPCPACRAPTPPSAATCPACGLLFATRLPAALHGHPRYLALRPLGDGGMGSVYLARDRLAGRVCVLKTVVTPRPRDLAWRDEAAACLRHEGELLTHLGHPGVVRLLDRTEVAGAPALVLEHLRGPSLEERLVFEHARRLPLHEVLALGQALAGTLCYLAGRPSPLAHGDIKPANVILATEGRGPVLLDFGGAVEQDRAPSDRYGTPGYAAPEQYHSPATPRSDVYGLGATLYHLVTGDDPTAHPLSFPALGALPRPVGELLRWALEREPQARPDAAQLLGRMRRVHPE